jgi:intraflagellar transport protein 172
MQLKYWKNIHPAVDGMQKIQSICWSNNGKRLAVATADRFIHLFDENGEKKDRFPTKASEKNQKSYIVRAMEFSSDSQKIAIAQSDNIVFIYKIGTEWGDKKSICNKFPTSSSVTCLAWPKERPNEVVFGLAEGKVRIGALRSNKSNVLYSTESYVISLASSRDGQQIVSGHLDGSVYTYNIESQAGYKILVHNCVPYALGWGENIVCAGNDGRVAFYDHKGNLLQKFDYTNDDKIKDFTHAAFNPSGETVVLGNFNRFYIYNYNARRQQWEEICVKHIENYYSVTAVCWKADGSKLVIGSLCGSVDLFDASMKKIKYKGKFEFNYVAPNQVIVKTLSDGNRSVVKSKYASEITKINIFQDRYVVANTFDSILLGDLTTNKISEVQWKGSGNEKYDFSNPSVCMIFNAGELMLVEYGNDDILGTCRTEYMKPHLISARLSYGKEDSATKIIAYLLDLQTISIQDLSTTTFVAQINHDAKIDFLELNSHANKLLFRDKRRQLYLFNLKTQTKNTLLSYCNYAQWVPNSEVVVAQNRNNLCVWYSIENPDKVTIYNIKGDVEEIERNEGKTDVIVNDGSNMIAYTLEEPLIEFGFAIESRDLTKAMEILDPLEMTPENEANWKTLANVALEEKNLLVAERCYSALGDISKAKYLHSIIKLVEKYKVETGKEDGLEYYKVQAKLALLSKQFYQAEIFYLNQNEVEEAMEMYQELHKWDKSIKIAEDRNHPDVKELKGNYFQWLLDTNQEESAAEVKENEGDYVAAINLYLKGGLPARAAYIVNTYSVNYANDLLEKVSAALIQAGMHEKAGEFYERMSELQRALDSYCKGNAFKKAVELAKRNAPTLVIQLEKKWGDWLVSQRQTESAINHYIEAAAFQEAIEAAISSRQWTKAVQLVANQSPEVARPFYRQIAKHYADVRQLDLAEKYYLKAGNPVEAFEIYIKSNKWEQALRVARDNLPEDEIVQLYARQGQRFEEQGSYKEAEKLYLTIEEPDLAINMYKKAQQYDNMIRLVSKYRKDLLKDTHLSIAQRLEKDGNYKAAEHHYIESGAWHYAVEMYKNSGLWEECIRVCRVNGTDRETCELAKKWADSMEPEKGIKMLLKMNLVDAVIEYLTERNEFQEAFKMAQQNAKHKIGDVHLKYALYLEDEKRYKEAEEEFIKAGKPNEAINMYELKGDWHSALQVAHQFEPHSVPAILMNQGKAYMELRDFAKAEQCYITAKKPEVAVKMYQELGQLTEAMRVAKKHAPHFVNTLNNSFSNKQGGQMSGTDLLASAKLWEEARDWQRAIDTYLEIKREHFSDPDVLEGAWEKAAHLASNYDKDRYQEVVTIVCKRLCDIGRYEQAAEHYENLGMNEEAVQCYIAARSFDKARECVAQIKNSDIASKLNSKIQRAYKDELVSRGDVHTLVQGQHDVQGGLEILVERGEWKQCLELANNQGPEVINRYLMKYAKVNMEAGKFGEAIAAFAKYGFLASQNNYPLYKTLCLEVFAECDPKEVTHLRTALYPFVTQLQSTNEAGSVAGREFSRYMLVSHLLNLKGLVEKKNLNTIAMKLAVSMLRYCDLIRMDKLYLEAGQICKKQNVSNMAHVLLNRYLDIYEVIEDPEGNPLSESPDFQLTDIPSPYDCPLPEKNLISEKEKSDLSDWLVKISMQHKDGKLTLNLRKCEKCSTQIAESALKCPKCQCTVDACIITGYPLVSGTAQKCKKCGKGGIKEHWTEYLQNFANCPWCNQLPN